jgi:hypothetical protein
MFFVNNRRGGGRFRTCIYEVEDLVYVSQTMEYCWSFHPLRSLPITRVAGYRGWCSGNRTKSLLPVRHSSTPVSSTKDVGHAKLSMDGR